MKTKDFIERMQSRGFVVGNDEYGTHVETSGDNTLVLISEEYSSALDTNYSGMTNFNPATRKELLELIIEYANTPIDERKEEKRYYIKFVHLVNYNYLNVVGPDKTIEFNQNENSGYYRTLFTEKAIEELPNWVSIMLKQGHLVKEEFE